jgi:hypothetical protein
MKPTKRSNKCSLHIKLIANKSRSGNSKKAKTQIYKKNVRQLLKIHQSMNKCQNGSNTRKCIKFQPHRSHHNEIWQNLKRKKSPTAAQNTSSINLNQPSVPTTMSNLKNNRMSLPLNKRIPMQKNKKKFKLYHFWTCTCTNLMNRGLN